MHLILAGAAPDTSNLGVSALCESTIVPISRRMPGHLFTVLDHGRGFRKDEYRLADGVVPFERIGAHTTRRWYRSDSWTRIWIGAKLGGWTSPEARRMIEASAILDVSGGDSFTDLYGLKRFHAVAESKRFAMAQGVPLILLPQTYGPFQAEDIRREAAELVRGARIAWARDAASFDRLVGLLGDAYDPNRHRSGVDLAFLLTPREPARDSLGVLAEWLDAGERVVGVNVSGLIYNNPVEARTRFGFRADYREVVKRLIRHVLDESRSRVALLSHVLVPPGWPESDLEASMDVARELEATYAGRLVTLKAPLDQAETKWVISKMDWFCGTRMHATIAGLSSSVPTAAIAYSLKTLGVFETCGMGSHVADPMRGDTNQVVGHLVQSWRDRAESRAALAQTIPTVLARGQAQIDHIVACLARFVHD